MADPIKEIREAVKQGNAAVGANEVAKGLKLGRLSKVYITKNCPAETEESIRHCASVDDVDVVNLKQTNEELGVLCKKPFMISVLGIVKGA